MQLIVKRYDTGHVAKQEVRYSLAREHAPYNQIVNPREISNNKARFIGGNQITTLLLTDWLL